MRILVACECSGTVRDAFRKLGHDCSSCDTQPCDSDTPQYHIQHDVLEVLDDTTVYGKWDLMVAHPPCTHIAVSGSRWFPEKIADGRQQDAIWFFMQMITADIPRICVENPVCIMSTKYRKPDQYIQPWQFGHGETKKTGLWLKNLPLLKPTRVVAGRKSRIHSMAPSPDRGKLRSVTYSGIARAMANQWGTL